MTGRTPDLGCRQLVSQACANLGNTMSEGATSFAKTTVKGLGWLGRKWITFEAKQHPLVGSLPHLAIIGGVTAAVSPPGLFTGAAVALATHVGLVSFKIAVGTLGFSAFLPEEQPEARQSSRIHNSTDSSARSRDLRS